MQQKKKVFKFRLKSYPALWSEKIPWSSVHVFLQFPCEIKLSFFLSTSIGTGSKATKFGKQTEENQSIK